MRPPSDFDASEDMFKDNGIFGSMGGADENTKRMIMKEMMDAQNKI